MRLSRELVRLKLTTRPCRCRWTTLWCANPDGHDAGRLPGGDGVPHPGAARVGDLGGGGGAPPTSGVIARTGVAKPVLAEDAIAVIDPTAYHCITDLETLDAWIARAREAGVVAFDTETDALGSASAGLCGISLAIAPGEAAYIPVGHCAAQGHGGLDFGDRRRRPAAQTARRRTAEVSPG